MKDARSQKRTRLTLDRSKKQATLMVHHSQMNDDAKKAALKMQQCETTGDWTPEFKDLEEEDFFSLGCDKLDCKDPENEGFCKTFFLSGEVLYVGIAEHQRMFPDPSLRIITREDWDKKAAESPSSKTPPHAKQSNKKRQTKPAKVVAHKRKSRSTAPVQKGSGAVGACKAMGDDCVNKSSPNQTTKCLECTIWVHPKKGCSIAKGNSFVCEVCWSKSESETSDDEGVEKLPPPIDKTH